jgi:hypothetical protein
MIFWGRVFIIMFDDKLCKMVRCGMSGDLYSDSGQIWRDRGGELGCLDGPTGGTSNFRDWFQIG